MSGQATCGRKVAIGKKGRRREHRDPQGHLCSGSHELVHAPEPVVLDDLPDVRLPPPAAEHRLGARAARKAYPEGDRVFCGGCGRKIPMNGDGTRRAHRRVADTFSGPYCPEGGDPNRSISGGKYKRGREDQ